LFDYFQRWEYDGTLLNIHYELYQKCRELSDRQASPTACVIDSQSEVLPRRWVVERTFAWLNRCRRLAKDFENRTRNALAFIRLASIRLMLRKLSNSNE